VRKIPDTAKKFLKRMPFHPVFRDWQIIVRWISAGRPVPPPHLIKQRIIRRYAKNFRLPVFIETGTYRGDMVEAVKGDFERIYSIELGEDLARKAAQRFAADPHVTVFHGDSGEILEDLLSRIDRPCLFWLDSHFSDAETARSELITPIRRELEHILAHPLARRHVILIDDARLFNGEDDYPTMDALRALLQRAGFGGCSVKDDVIRIRG
jgi:hypothetical protein